MIGVAGTVKNNYLKLCYNRVTSITIKGVVLWQGLCHQSGWSDYFYFTVASYDEERYIFTKYYNYCIPYSRKAI